MPNAYLINSTTMTSLASAVRTLRGESSTYTPSQIISNIYPISFINYNTYETNVSSVNNSKAQFISATALSNRSSLTTAIVPNCEYIGQSAFYRCKLLSTISFPKCKMIDEAAFWSCSALTTASFPSCTYINYGAFYDCFNLTTVSFPNCIYMGTSIFRNCAFSAVLFPKCTNIGYSAFGGCTLLKTASFPKCTNIEDYAFYNCTVLSSLYLNQVTTVTSLSTTFAFSGTPLSAGGTGKIYVPNSLLASFKAASVWSYLSARLVGM